MSLCARGVYGKRAYRVTCDAKDFWTFANSPGQAALNVCMVERVKDRELTDAALNALRQSKTVGGE